MSLPPQCRTSIPHGNRFRQAFSAGSEVSQGELFIICTAAAAISVYFSRYAQHFQRYLADLYHTKLYLILYLPLRDLSGVLWYSVGSSPRIIKDLLCRKTSEYYPCLFTQVFSLFMVSSWHLWQFSVIYCLRSKYILLTETYTTSL